MSGKRRKIILSKNNLDPISRWYFSKDKFGDVYGNKIINPIVTDHRLYVSPTRDAGLNGGEAHVQWNLSGINDNGEQIAPNITNLTDFVNAALADDIERFLQFEQDNNQFIFVEKAIGDRGERYTSFPADMLEALLTTAHYGLEETYTEGTGISTELSQYSMRNVNGNVIVNRTFGSFVDTLRGAQFSFGGDRFGDWFAGKYALLRGVVQSGQVTEVAMPLLLAFVGALIKIEGETAQIKKLAQYFVFAEVAKIVPESILRDAILANNNYDQRHHYVEIDTPYVSTKQSYDYLEEISTGEPYRAELTSDYSYLSQEYEEEVVNENFVENLLPNTYTRHYFKSLAQKRATSGPLSANEERKYQEFKIILGLSNNVKEEALLGIYDSFYYNSYGAAIKDVDLDNQVIKNIVTRNSSVIIDATQINEVGLDVGTPPMNIGVEFTRDEIGNSIDLVTGENSERLTDAGSIIFENIKQQGDDAPTRLNLYATQYLTNRNNGIEEKESPYATVQLKEFSLAAAFRQFLRFPEFSSLILNTTTENIPQSLLAYALGLGGIGNTNSRRSYGSIVSSRDSKSESLGYRIRKTLPNETIQDFYIGNGRGQKVLTYRDSQVKYGVEYKYSLSEYRIIYGTKYKFRVVSPDLPLWVMENYLGLSSNAQEKIQEIGASQEQIPGREQQEVIPIPNITFNAYVQEIRDAVITEIPIYDESFNAQNIFNLLSEDEASYLIGGDIGGRGSISYPSAKVMDRPPTAPVLDVFPMVGIKDQIKLSVNLETGNNTGANAREIISIGDLSAKITELKQYQDKYTNRALPPNKLEYKNEGISELRNIIVYRTTSIDLAVQNYNDIYKSFNPETNSDVVVRKFTDKTIDSEQFPDIQQVSSYDLRDTIEPNVNYYYTCVVEDFHGNPSNPSIIYRVRLLFDKGLLVPEVDTVLPNGFGNQKPQKNLAQFVQIDASNIQTLPYVNAENGGFSAERSLGASLGKSIEEQGYIIRLTSKDTGRKFDVKLNFVVRVDGSPINEGT
tara:strand:+ start:1537 stop:4593 length:3057 start_codon:yes stop_codon:yes gene_type:complete